MNACADKEFVAADADLNRAYKAALADIPEMASEPPYDAKNWEQALRKSQRAWVAFRDAECNDHVAMFWSGGTGATAEIIGCMTDKTKARTKELKERYEAP
ncbi:MAG: lysozyme inhibitor LprI family protein, partial [Hyphomicrobium sp.]